MQSVNIKKLLEVITLNKQNFDKHHLTMGTRECGKRASLSDNERLIQLRYFLEWTQTWVFISSVLLFLKFATQFLWWYGKNIDPLIYSAYLPKITCRTILSKMGTD
jgi:hypothetical protein